MLITKKKDHQDRNIDIIDNFHNIDNYQKQDKVKIIDNIKKLTRPKVAFAF